MDETFKSILNSLLEQYEQGKSADEILASVSNNVSKKSKADLQKTSELLERFEEKYNELIEAKEDDISRVEWVESELKKQSDAYGLSDNQQKELLDGISLACTESINNIKKGESSR